MLIGRREALGLEIQPLTPTWERRYVPEQVGWAALSIWVRSTNLCRHITPGSDRVEDSVRVPLCPLVDWICRSWTAICHEERPGVPVSGKDAWNVIDRWSMANPCDGLGEDSWFERREQWWGRHFLLAGADGARLPNVALAREDESLIVCAGPTRFVGERAPIFQTQSGLWAVPWEAAREALAELASTIGGWLRDEGIAHLYPWASRHDPLQAAEGDLWEQLRYLTGHDQPELTLLAETRDENDLLQWLGLSAICSDPASSPVTQALRDLPPSVSSGARMAICELRERTKRPAGGCSQLADFRSQIRTTLPPISSPEEAGQLAAQGLRSLICLDGRPIDDIEAQARSMGVDVVVSGLAGETARMVAGWIADGSPVVVLLNTPRTVVSWGRRFEVARALGHLLIDATTQNALGAAGSPYATQLRRRRSGAFAAELLIPESALSRASAGRLDGAASDQEFSSLMREYGVGARVAAHQLFNRGWLSSGELRDELIEAHGREPASS